MSGHTPGPWPCIRLENENGPYATNYIAHIDCGVCMVWAPVGNSEREANARLIAAAPDLLAALELMVKEHRKQFGLDGAWDSCLLKAEAALAKAKGETP